MIMPIRYARSQEISSHSSQEISAHSSQFIPSGFYIDNAKWSWERVGVECPLGSARNCSEGHWKTWSEWAEGPMAATNEKPLRSFTLGIGTLHAIVHAIVLHCIS